MFGQLFLFFYFSKCSPIFYVVYNIIVNTLSSPLSQILSNCGVGVDTEIIQHIKQNGGGYDAKNEEYVDMFEAGIIDPTKVTRCAIENASSVAGMILTTECMVVDKKEKENKQV